MINSAPAASTVAPRTHISQSHCLHVFLKLAFITQKLRARLATWLCSAMHEIRSLLSGGSLDGERQLFLFEELLS